MGKKANVGGQAVIEGVMMRGTKGVATAVRKANGEIAVNFEDSIPLTKKNKFFGIPFIRGFVTLIESLIIGFKTLDYSSNVAMEGVEEEPSKLEVILSKIFKDNAGEVLTAISAILGVGFAILLFMIVPTTIVKFLMKLGMNKNVLLNLIEGIIVICIFIIYIVIISKLEDMYRVFQYHGAEHKTIACYENNEELTPENVKKYQRFHSRCGTNFMFLVMIVSIALFSFLSFGSIFQRIIMKLALLPVVSGITYEIIRWISKNDSKLSKIVAYPGMKLQRLTTKEPDLSQIEVAIKSLKVAEGIDNLEDIKN